MEVTYNFDQKNIEGSLVIINQYLKHFGPNWCLIVDIYNNLNYMESASCHHIKHKMAHFMIPLFYYGALVLPYQLVSFQ